MSRAPTKRSIAQKKAAPKGAALARVGDPLITSTGAKVDPEGYSNGRPIPKAQPDMVLDAATFRPLKRRNLKDLPAEVGTINGVAAVFMYTMLGIGDREIADALRIDAQRLEEVRAHTAYKECFDTVLGEFINKNSDMLAARIAAYSHSALEKVGDLSVNAQKEETQLRASIDILDRAGVRPKDNEQRQVTQKSELRIIVVKADEKSKIDIDIGADDDISA